MSAASDLIWFRLVDDATGKIYPNTDADFVTLPPGSVIAQFRDAVKAKYKTSLESVDAGKLKVYKDTASFEKRNADEGKVVPLVADSSIADLGRSVKEALIVVVPAVVVPAPIVYNKRSRVEVKVEWTEHTSTLAQLTYDSASQFVQLDTRCFEKIGQFPEKLVLYCRPEFHKQFQFLRDEVLKKGVLGWILGPPGTGKSTTSLVFAATLDRKEWVVTWIRLRRGSHPECIRLEENSDKYREIDYDNDERSSDILREVDVSQHHIVFMDGFVSKEDNHSKVLMDCKSWLKGDKARRRLVVVCSMSSRYIPNDVHRSIQEENCFVHSWEEQEYVNAVQNDEFFQHVKQNLDAQLTDAQLADTLSPADLVHSKYHFAGASARWMFDFSTRKVIEQTEESINYVDDIMPYFKVTLGDQHDNVVNRLLGTRIFPGMSKRKTFITSEFASVKLAIKAGRKLITKLAKATRQYHNPSMKGWMFEMWFFASLRECGVTLFKGSGEEFETWPASDVETLDFKVPPTLLENGGIWYKPNIWNQGGFDAIYLHKGKGLVKFVQVTRADSHAFKLQHFRKFLLKLTP